MQNSGPLAPFGIAIIALTAFLIAGPYMRRRSDALTAWNLFLLGGGLFMGMGSLEVVYGIWHWPELQWFTINAMKSAFIPFDERLALINDVIKPGYAALMA